MSAQVNEAHRKLVAAIIRDLSIDDAARLIADSEARAVDHTWRAERDQLRAQVFNLEAEVATLRKFAEQVTDRNEAEVERLNALGSWAHTCIHHTDEERKAWAACPCCAIARADRAEAEAERYRLVTLKQDAKLATAKERLRSEAMDDYASIKDLQRELAAERGKLDWVFQNCKVEANDYSTGNRDVYYVHDREDLGVAMKEDAK